MGESELIDTLWNVNWRDVVIGITDIQELIDTLWNVNIFLHFILDTCRQRINRYIMECKYKRHIALP